MLVDDLVAFPCVDAESFPRVKGPIQAALTVRCPARLLSEVVAQVAFAALPDTRDTILSNVWLQLDGKTAAFAASNGSRCALRTVLGTDSQARGELLLVPARSLAAIARLLPRQGEVQMEVAPHKGLLCVRSDDREFIVRLIDPHVRPIAGEDPVAQHSWHGKSRPFEQYIPKSLKTLVVLSKWDAKAVSIEDVRPQLARRLRQRPPVIAVSAHTGRGVGRILDEVEHLYEKYAGRVPTPALNRALRELREARQPPSRNGKRLNLLYGSQVRTRPPRFRLHVNDPSLVTRDYGYWVENELRRRFDLEGVPVSIDFVPR